MVLKRMTYLLTAPKLCSSWCLYSSKLFHPSLKVILLVIINWSSGGEHRLANIGSRREKSLINLLPGEIS